VLGVNNGCGTSGALQSWLTTVTSHERDHEKGLRNCLGSAWTQAKIDTLEAIVEISAFNVVDEFNDMWKHQLIKKFNDARLRGALRNILVSDSGGRGHDYLLGLIASSGPPEPGAAGSVWCEASHQLLEGEDSVRRARFGRGARSGRLLRAL
jgi:hypothetical protein